MRRAVLAGLVAGLVTLGAPVAQAGSASDWRGGCDFRDASTELQWPRTYSGPVSVRIVLFSTVPADNPVSAVVTCATTVNGVVVDSATFSGTGLVAGVAHTSYVVSEGDVVERCTTVDYTSDDTPTYQTCRYLPGTGLPYPYVYACYWFEVPATGLRDRDPLEVLCDDVVLPVVESAGHAVDAATCPALATVGQSGVDVPGVLDVHDDGDVYVDGAWVWDCPPYGG